jgi:hypothetical protein
MEPEMVFTDIDGRQYIERKENPNLAGLKMGADVLEDGVLEQRQIILDNLLLSSPPVVAQRIRIELIKECMKFPMILLPSTLIL